MNTAVQYQDGERNDASSFQWGNSNAATQIQLGQRNEASSTQVGDENTLLQYQQGNDNSAANIQTGDNNIAAAFRWETIIWQWEPRQETTTCWFNCRSVMETAL
jgi:hypothetical protein